MTTHKLASAALVGLLSAGLLVAQPALANEHEKSSCKGNMKAEKSECKGKSSGDEKSSCKGKDKEASSCSSKMKEKSSCKSKSGCSGKNEEHKEKE